MKPPKRTRPCAPIVVYPIKAKNGSKWGDKELLFSLRSVCKYLRLPSGEVPKVFILTVAELPFLNRDQVTVLPVSGYADAVRVAIKLAKEHSPTGDYIWMNDDICFLKPTTPQKLYPPLRMGKMRPGKGEKRVDTGGWRWKLIQIRDRLGEMGVSPIFNFSTHSPYLFNAEKMEIVAGLFGLVYKTPLETAYFNFWGHELGSIRSHDRLVKHLPPKDFDMDLSGKRFLNYADGGLNSMLKGFLHGAFPNPSRFEV